MAAKDFDDCPRLSSLLLSTNGINRSQSIAPYTVCREGSVRNTDQTEREEVYRVRGMHTRLLCMLPYPSLPIPDRDATL